MSMNTATDNIVGTLTVVAIFIALALPSLIGLARDRRLDRQLREAQRTRREAERIGPTERIWARAEGDAATRYRDGAGGPWRFLAQVQGLRLDRDA